MTAGPWRSFTEAERLAADNHGAYDLEITRHDYELSVGFGVIASYGDSCTQQGWQRGVEYLLERFADQNRQLDEALRTVWRLEIELAHAQRDLTRFARFPEANPARKAP